MRQSTVVQYIKNQKQVIIGVDNLIGYFLRAQFLSGIFAS